MTNHDEIEIPGGEVQGEDKVTPKGNKENSKVLYIDPNELKPHPKNDEIYGLEDVDDDLVESILVSGQLEPMIITDNNIIISGHRRWRALKKINDSVDEKDKRKAICFYKPMTELEELEAIVESNRQRTKNLVQIYREAKLLDEVYAKRAKERQKYSLKKGAVVPNLEQRDEQKNEAGRTIEKEAKILGIGKTQLASLKKIGDRGDDRANAIMDELSKGAIKIDTAHKKLKLMDIASDPNNPDVEVANSLLEAVENKKLKPSSAWNKFNEYKNEKKASESKTNNSKGMYNVVVAYSSSINEAMSLKGSDLTDAKDVALFLLANPDNLKETVKLMEQWGFSLKSIAIWDNEKPNGTWFRGEGDLLLFGVKGDMAPPADKNRFPIIIKDNGDKLHFVYTMAELMFPGQQYCDPFRNPNRIGWNGQPTISSPGLADTQDSDMIEPSH